MSITYCHTWGKNIDEDVDLEHFDVCGKEEHKHEYKQTGTVMVNTGKYWAWNLTSGDTKPMELPITNIDTSVTPIRKECLVFICNCGDMIIKDIPNTYFKCRYSGIGGSNTLL